MKWKFNWAFQREDSYILCESNGAEEKARELIKNSFGKEADEWLSELETVSKEAFLGMRDMNGDFTIGIIIYSEEPPLPKVNDVVKGMTALLMEGMERYDGPLSRSEEARPVDHPQYGWTPSEIRRGRRE